MLHVLKQPRAAKVVEKLHFYWEIDHFGERILIETVHQSNLAERA